MNWVGDEVSLNTKIYRYLPYSRLFASSSSSGILTGIDARPSGLYFPTLHQQSDKMEGIPSFEERETVWREKYKDLSDQDLNNLEKRTVAKLKLTHVSCWTLEEEFNPWRAIAYGAQVIIESTIEKILDAIKSENPTSDLYLGKVNYQNSEQVIRENYIEYAFQKLPIFEAENEFRFIIPIAETLKDQIDNMSAEEIKDTPITCFNRGKTVGLESNSISKITILENSQISSQQIQTIQNVCSDLNISLDHKNCTNSEEG